MGYCLMGATMVASDTRSCAVTLAVNPSAVMPLALKLNLYLFWLRLARPLFSKLYSEKAVSIASGFPVGVSKTSMFPEIATGWFDMTVGFLAPQPTVSSRSKSPPMRKIYFIKACGVMKNATGLLKASKTYSIDGSPCWQDSY